MTLVLHFFPRSIVTAAESGHVKLWRFKGSEQVEINAINSGETLSRMRVSPNADNIIATGGKKNDLQIWDLLSPHQPLFKAKNVSISNILNSHHIYKKNHSKWLKSSVRLILKC